MLVSHNRIVPFAGKVARFDADPHKCMSDARVVTSSPHHTRPARSLAVLRQTSHFVHTRAIGPGSGDNDSGRTAFSSRWHRTAQSAGGVACLDSKHAPVAPSSLAQAPRGDDPAGRNRASV